MTDPVQFSVHSS